MNTPTYIYLYADTRTKKKKENGNTTLPALACVPKDQMSSNMGFVELVNKQNLTSCELFSIMDQSNYLFHNESVLINFHNW